MLRQTQRKGVICQRSPSPYSPSKERAANDCRIIEKKVFVKRKMGTVKKFWIPPVPRLLPSRAGKPEDDELKASPLCKVKRDLPEIMWVNRLRRANHRDTEAQRT
jgi:hypothetical protein